MSTVAAPYGLRPINLIGGLPYSGSTRQIKIASGYATNIFYGDIVAIATDGTLVKVTATGADATPNNFPAGVVGLFLGCAFTQTTGLKYFVTQKNWVASTVATDAVAYVYDNPDALFQVQANGSLAQTALGGNIAVVQNAGDEASGMSRVTVNVATLAASTFLPFRIVDFVQSTTSQPGDAFTDVIVKFNAGIHSYTSATGVA